MLVNTEILSLNPQLAGVYNSILIDRNNSFPTEGPLFSLGTLTATNNKIWLYEIDGSAESVLKIPPKKQIICQSMNQ